MFVAYVWWILLQTFGVHTYSSIEDGCLVVVHNESCHVLDEFVSWRMYPHAQRHEIRCVCEKFCKLTPSIKLNLFAISSTLQVPSDLKVQTHLAIDQATCGTPIEVKWASATNDLASCCSLVIAIRELVRHDCQHIHHMLITMSVVSSVRHE